MWGYFIRKLLLSVPTLLIVAMLVFTLMRLIPGDPAVVMVGAVDDPAVVEEMRRHLGLDKPLVAQFFIWLTNAVSGDFGASILSGEPVFEAVLKRFMVTLQVVLPATIIAVLVAVPAGLYAAWKQNRFQDLMIMFGVILAISVPSFWVGMLLILFFGVQLGWLPTVGYVSPAADFWLGVSFLVLPVLSLVFVEMASLTRMMRSNSIEVMRQDYIAHARAKGVSETAVLYKHALKNSFAPTLTLLGLILGSLLGGATVIETVFSLPGLGRFLVDGIYARDYPVVQGVLMFVSLIYVLTNLIVDVLYPLLDPRVRL